MRRGGSTLEVCDRVSTDGIREAENKREDEIVRWRGKEEFMIMSGEDPTHWSYILVGGEVREFRQRRGDWSRFSGGGGGAGLGFAAIGAQFGELLGQIDFCLWSHL